MKSIGLAIATALAAAVFAAPLAASAQSYSGGGGAPSQSYDKPESSSSAAKLKPFDKDAITKGKAEAPAVITSAGIPCTMTDAAYVGASTGKDDKGKEVKQAVYEVSCSEGLGYGLVQPVGQTAKAYDCLALQGNASLACRLPENADPKRGLQSMASQVGGQCTISDARYLGSKPNGESFYEVGCGSTPGFILDAVRGSPPKRIGCDQIQAGGPLSCKFTTQAQLDAAANTAAGALLAQSGKTCQMSKSRAIGPLQSGDFAYEVACSDGTGYIIEAANTGAYHTAISCANAGDACKLTDATKVESAETGVYTRLAKAGGFQCDVAKYRYIGMDQKTNSEVVELQCANRPDGVFAKFPSDNSGRATFYDCIQAGALGQTCKLSDPSVVYDKYTQALASQGKKTCKVSNAHWLALTTEGDNYVETACSDGLPGWVILMTPSGSAKEVQTCGQVKGAGVVCTLPGNTK